MKTAAIGILACLGLGIACKARKDAPAAPAVAVADSTPAEEVPESAPAPMAVAAPTMTIRPACDQYRLTDNGAAALEIGDARDSIRTRCVVLNDSTARDTEGSVRGEVVVGVNDARLVAEVADDRVYRLALTDTLFRTMDGLGPGVAVTRLLDMPGAVVLEGAHDLSIVVNAHCGLYFRISKPATQPENIARWADFVRAMPPGTPVERVVVHGCRTPAS